MRRPTNVIPGSKLRKTINNLTDIERYELLATLRTGKHISDEQKQLRWYFLRMIVTRAYIRAYKRSYSVDREWYESTDEPVDRYHRVVSYDMELERVLELADHIRTYNVPKNIKLKQGYTIDTAAVALALSAYFHRFIQYDMTILFQMKGVSFREYHFHNYQPINITRKRYSRILELDKYLRSAEWDVQQALKAWVKDKNDNYDAYMTSGVTSLDRNNKRPTPAMILGIYARMLRHATLYGICQGFSIESMVEDYDTFASTTDPFYNAVNGIVYASDIAVRYKELIRESTDISIGKRKNDFY